MKVLKIIGWGVLFLASLTALGFGGLELFIAGFDPLKQIDPAWRGPNNILWIEAWIGVPLCVFGLLVNPIVIRGWPSAARVWFIYTPIVVTGTALAAAGIFAVSWMYGGPQQKIADYAPTFANIKRAAEAGSAPAAFNLALLYEQGQVGDGSEAKVEDIDFTQAIAWYEKAYLWGRPEATVNLAVMLLRDRSTMDQRRAVKLLEEGAESYDPDTRRIAFSLLGLCYESGLGTEIDRDKAISSYKEAAYLGDTSAGVTLRLWGVEGFETWTYPEASESVEAGDESAEAADANEGVTSEAAALDAPDDPAKAAAPVPVAPANPEPKKEKKARLPL